MNAHRTDAATHGQRNFLTLVADKGSDIGQAGSRTLIERAYEQLRDDIIEGRLAPDEKLRVERLKAHYQVGAGTLREAITQLVSDALVVAEGQRGFRVAPIALEDMEDLTRLRLHIEIDAFGNRSATATKPGGRGCSRHSTNCRQSSNQCARNIACAGSNSTTTFTRC